MKVIITECCRQGFSGTDDEFENLVVTAIETLESDRPFGKLEGVCLPDNVDFNNISSKLKKSLIHLLTKTD